jgi:hypothetical protein
MNPADFNTAAAIVQHQLTEALPHLSPLIVKFVAPTLQIRTRQPQENPAHLRAITQALRNCPEGLSRLPIQTVTIYGMQGDRTILWKRSIPLATVLNQQAEKDNRDPFSFNNQWINRAAFPIAFLFGLLAHWTGFDRLLFGVRLWIHEVGHATVAWFSGHHATPLPFGWTNVGEERSVMVYGLFALLWGLLGWVGWKEGKRVSMGIAAIALVIQFWMTWLMPESGFETWLAFGGVGGEFVLSTLLLVAFYIPLPDRWQWEFWRYPTLGLAASTFVGAFSFWHQVKRGTADIPWGSLLGGDGDAGGDMNRLSDAGWSDLHIVQTYTSLGNLCLWILIGIYVLRLVKLERLGRKY